MISSVSSALLLQSSQLSLSDLPKPSPLKIISKSNPFSTPNDFLGVGSGNLPMNLHPLSKRDVRFLCHCNTKESPQTNVPEKEAGLGWPFLERWDVPWEWQTVLLTMLASGLGFVLTGFVLSSAEGYLGLNSENLSLDEKAEVLFVEQFIVTTVILGAVYGLTRSFQPLSDDLFCYKWKEPFNPHNGWLLWAGVGISFALLSVALVGVALSLLSGGNPEREKDALVLLEPLIGSSSIRTACLLGITGILGPLREEILFRGFLMVSLTKWVSTPVSVLMSAAVFALAHRNPGEFPQIFVFGVMQGFSYAQTRNLLVPIIVHALWNSGLLLVLTFLQLQGYDLRELVHAGP